MKVEGTEPNSSPMAFLLACPRSKKRSSNIGRSDYGRETRAKALRISLSDSSDDFVPSKKLIPGTSSQNGNSGASSQSSGAKATKRVICLSSDDNEKVSTSLKDTIKPLQSKKSKNMLSFLTSSEDEGGRCGLVDSSRETTPVRSKVVENGSSSTDDDITCSLRPATSSESEEEEEKPRTKKRLRIFSSDELSSTNDDNDALKQLKRQRQFKNVKYKKRKKRKIKSNTDSEELDSEGDDDTPQTGCYC